MRLILRVLPLAACASLFGACKAGETSGSLTVEYQFAPGATCESRGVESVYVALVQNGAEKAEDEAPCENGGAVEIDSAPTGNFDLVVHGQDAIGDTVMDNLGGSTDDEHVEIIGGSAAEKTVLLQPTPAQIRVRWSFDGGFGQCGQVPPAFFDVTAFDDNSAILINHEFACADPPDADGGFHTVPDPMRLISGDDLSAVRVLINDSQNALLDTEDLTFDPPGSGKAVDITINCEGSNCSSSAMSSAGDEGSMDDTGGTDSTSG
jgi:hypothetical protein